MTIIAQSIVTLKAFGDFVIACNAIKRLASTNVCQSTSIVAGTHVIPLAQALGVASDVQYIGSRDSIDVPAAFDLRKRGLVRGVSSLLELRQLLHSLQLKTPLLFDQLSWRERFIGSGMKLNSLPMNSGNIHIAYENFFRNIGCEFDDIRNNKEYPVREAIIIPGARMSHRIIPNSVINNIVYELKELNIKAKVIFFEGELVSLPTSIQVIKIPRNFESLVEVIKTSDLVISADSLPSHLSEYLEIPIFVSTPSPKPYWLPRSAYLTTAWATFSDTKSLREWICHNLHF